MSPARRRCERSRPTGGPTSGRSSHQDGKALLIARSGGGKHSVIAYDVATGHETVLAADLDGEDRRGPLVAGRLAGRLQRGAEGEPGSSRLFVVRADGTGPRQLGTDTRHLVGLRPRVVAGRHARSPLPGTSSPTGPSGRPADRDLLDGRRDGAVRRPAATRRPLPVPGARRRSASPGEGFFFDWSPDGRSLLAYPSEAVGHAIIIDTVDGTWRGLDPVLDAAGARCRSVRAGSVSRPDDVLRRPDRPDKGRTPGGRARGSRCRRLGCGERIRTSDLRVMSPTSCRCSTPRPVTLGPEADSVKPWAWLCRSDEARR